MSPLGYALVVVGILIVAAAAIPVDVWYRWLDRPPDTRVRCVHTRRSHRARYDPHDRAWKLCQRGRGFRIIPGRTLKDTEP